MQTALCDTAYKKDSVANTTLQPFIVTLEYLPRTHFTDWIDLGAKYLDFMVRPEFF